MRPEFITKEKLRVWAKPKELTEMLSIDGIQAGSYIARCERDGWPIPCKVLHGTKRYRALDIVARARAQGHNIQPPKCKPGDLKDKIAQLQNEKRKLEESIACFTQQQEQLRAKIAGADELDVADAIEQFSPHAVLTEKEIVAVARPVKSISGVYFLVHKGKVVYVGQSANVPRRIAAHEAQRKFDSVAFIPLPLNLLSIVEALYIHCLRPEGNIGMERGQVVAPIGFRRLLESLACLR